MYRIHNPKLILEMFSGSVLVHLYSHLVSCTVLSRESCECCDYILQVYNGMGSGVRGKDPDACQGVRMKVNSMREQAES